MTAHEKPAKDGLKPETPAPEADDIAPFGQLLYKTKSSSVHLWKSKISWRITLTVFETILVIQACILAFTVRNTERDLLDGLHQTAAAAIAPALLPAKDQLTSPLTKEIAQNLISHTIVQGMTVYGLDYNAVAQ